MIKFKNGQLEVKFMDSTIVVLSNKRNVFNLIYDEDVKTLQELETSIKCCKNNFKFKMSFNSREDVLKVVLNNATYILNAMLV